MCVSTDDLHGTRRPSGQPVCPPQPGTSLSSRTEDEQVRISRPIGEDLRRTARDHFGEQARPNRQMGELRLDQPTLVSPHVRFRAHVDAPADELVQLGRPRGDDVAHRPTFGGFLQRPRQGRSASLRLVDADHDPPRSPCHHAPPHGSRPFRVTERAGREPGRWYARRGTKVPCRPPLTAFERLDASPVLLVVDLAAGQPLVEESRAEVLPRPGPLAARTSATSAQMTSAGTPPSTPSSTPSPGDSSPSRRGPTTSLPPRWRPRKPPDCTTRGSARGVPCRRGGRPTQAGPAALPYCSRWC